MKLTAPTDTCTSTSMTVSAGAAAAAAKHILAGPANSVRFTLRKRSARPDEKCSNAAFGATNADVYNADFLSGLFADIAQASVLSELEIPSPTASASQTVHDVDSSFSSISSSSASDATPTAITETNTDTIFTRPSKKSRLALSLNATPFRARPSVKNLLQLPAEDGTKSPRSMSEELRQHNNSLAMQLSSLSSSYDDAAVEAGAAATAAHSTHEVSPSPEGSPVSEKQVIRKNLADDAVRLAFPNLPHTVSLSSCVSGSSRSDSGKLRRQVSELDETSESKDSNFGWFVDLDEYHGAANGEATNSGSVQVPYAVSSDNLAFKAPTAPALLASTEIADHEAEVEWAMAADTVDDVLGDFF